MSHPTVHAAVSVKIWGGRVEDYLPIHDWLDASKEMFCDFRHRALRHHSHGIFEAERLFGHELVNSDGKKVPVRYVCEQHIKEDCGGRVPSVSDWLSAIRVEPWMSKGYRIDTEEYCRAPGCGGRISAGHGKCTHCNTNYIDDLPASSAYDELRRVAGVVTREGK